MSSLRVALLQAMPAGWDQEINQARGLDLCRSAKERGADIALFPEMWNVGYHFSDPAKSGGALASQAIATQGEFIGRFRELARELNMAIAITYLQEWDQAPRNAVSLIDRHGEIRLTYAKIHTCPFGPEASVTPGEGFHVCTLDTSVGDVGVGAMICYDREFPESARLLMLQGAEIILAPNACVLDRHRLGQFNARAYENMVGLAMTNYPAPHVGCNGHSIAVDPVVFGEDGETRDTVLVEAGQESGVSLAEFDMSAIRSFRKKGIWGNAYRKPRMYTALTSLEVREPFVRSDSSR